MYYSRTDAILVYCEKKNIASKSLSYLFIYYNAAQEKRWSVTIMIGEERERESCKGDEKSMRVFWGIL